jgi:antitoxin (DNA-binding transcriptional repressor) of toxin-antitoxin stability system
MATIPLQDAQAQLPDLIHNLKPGEELIITENDRPLAKLVAQGLSSAQRPGPGLCKDMITIVAEDDEHLQDFAEYMAEYMP